MIKFADEAVIEVVSGKGGNGCIAFRREKYVPLGGPAGGDGGRGGDVIFVVKKNLRTLAHLRYKQKFKAKNGADGEGKKRFGKDGDDVIIPLPPGSIIRDAKTKTLIREFTTESEDEQFVFLEGGNGGWGNCHFKTSTNQAPKYAHDGKPGESRMLLVELNIMADIGLVGFPNAGKSSLLDFFTNARPKIAPYPFTTKIPNLGVLRVDNERDIIIADIPGIIEGASSGAGLGFKFLKHISRTSGLAFIIDCSDEECFGAFDKLKLELENFSKELISKPRIVLCNKLDIEGASERFKKIKTELKNETVLGMSIFARKGMNDVRKAIVALVDNVEEKEQKDKESTVAQKSEFMAERSVCNDMEIQYPGQE